MSSDGKGYDPVEEAKAKAEAPKAPAKEDKKRFFGKKDAAAAAPVAQPTSAPPAPAKAAAPASKPAAKVASIPGVKRYRVMAETQINVNGRAVWLAKDQLISSEGYSEKVLQSIKAHGVKLEEV